MRYNEGTMKKQSKENYTEQQRQDYEDLINDDPNKIQIRLPGWVYNVLKNDLDTYNITCEDNPSMTDLVSRILMAVNEFRDFERQTKTELLKLADQYAEEQYDADIKNTDYDDRMASLLPDEKLYLNNTISLLKDNEAYYYFDKLSQRIDVHKTLYNASTLMSIYSFCDEDEGLTIGKYIKKLLEWYVIQPAYKRERILFYKTVKEINEIIDGNNVDGIFYTVNMKDVEPVVIKPYIMVPASDAIHNYLLGIRIKDGKTMGTTLRIDNIDTFVNRAFCIDSNHKPCKFTNKELDTIKLMMDNHPAFNYNTLGGEEYILRFNKVVAEKYKKVYTHRPKYTKIKDNKDGTYDYAFNCSEEQLKKYLVRLMTSFDDNLYKEASIEVISPQAFKDSFKDFYLKYANIIKD